jgi:hypothetical protein
MLTHQCLHHLSRGFEVEVEAQIAVRGSFRDQERFGKLDLDGGGNFVNGVQKALDLKGRLRVRRAIIHLEKR